MPAPPPSKSTQCAVLLPLLPCAIMLWTLPKNRGDSLLWDFFFPLFVFFLPRKLSAGGGGQGPASSVPSFHLPLCQA